MMQKILFLTAAAGCIFLCKDPIFALFNKSGPNSSNIAEYLTKKEQEKIPFLIALSLKEMISENTLLAPFIEGLKIAEQEKANNYQKSPEIQAYLAYAIQLTLDPKITKNLETSAQYFRKKQDMEGVFPLVNHKICYKILKSGNGIGIEDNRINKVTINFTIKDAEDNLLAGNYALSGPISCSLSELIPGMAHGMLGMRLNELREIYIHPEFAYGVFSDFGNGALSIQVELVECEATGTAFYPCLIPVDLAKFHYPGKADITSLQEDYISFCGKAAWSFYRQKLPQLHLDDVLFFLQKEDIALSPEDREILYKLQWLIYKNQNNF